MFTFNHLRMPRALISRLLTLVSPRCDGCARPATKFEGSNYGSSESPLKKKKYFCDEHSPAKGFTDLPGADTLREANKYVT